MLDLAEDIARKNLERVRVKEDFIASCCPFHADRSPSFWISRESGAWGCFGCGAKGSNLKLLLQELGVRDKVTEDQIERELKDKRKTRAKAVARKKKQARASLLGTHVLPESILGIYDFAPLDLIEDGFQESILVQHDIGYDRERNRITFPIRDLEGSLVGISGRTTIGEFPKYKVYTGRRTIEGREIMGELGEWFPDYSSSDIRNHLWRANAVFEDIYHGRSEQLIIVEGYKACLWLVQNGWTNTVALMGSRMSAAQERIVRRMGTPTWILLDKNEAGQSGTNDICDRLGIATFPVYRCTYEPGKDDSVQPDDLDAEELDEMFSSATKAKGKRKRRYDNSRKESVKTD